MAIAVDQTSGEQNFDNIGTDPSWSFGTAPAAGSTVVVSGFFWGGSSADITDVTDNKGNSYALYKSTANNGQSVAFVAVALNVTSGGTFTVTLAGVPGGSYLTASADSWTGLLTAGAVDQTNAAGQDGPQSTDATVATPSTTTQADELVYAACALGDSGVSDVGLTSPAGFTNLAVEQDFTARCAGSVDYKIVAAAGVQTAAWSHNDITNTGSGFGWTAVIVTLKAAGGANTLVCDTGSFALTGNTVGLTTQRALVATVADFVLTGIDVILTFTGLGAFSLVCDTGVFSLTGVNVALNPQSPPGVFVLTGNNVGLLIGPELLADVGVFTLTGNAAVLFASRTLASATGVFTLTGTNIGMAYSAGGGPGGGYVGLDVLGYLDIVLLQEVV